jgi:hypothetical protein
VNGLRVRAAGAEEIVRPRRLVSASGRPLNFTVRRSRTQLDTSSLLWGLLFGSIGLGFFVYGRRQKMVVPLVCGVALMIFPYFISSTILLVMVGVALIGIPYFVRM